jgi:beta-lactamase class A
VLAYREIDQGTLNPDERSRLRDEDRIPGSGVLSHMHEGLELTLADLLLLMIAVSDNTATNLVLDHTGLEAVNATMQSLGMTDSVLGRRILGHLPKPGDPENWATPGDFARAIHAIVTNEAATPESCAQMLETLEQQGEIRRISRFVPSDPGVSWGTKPGDLPGVINDVGFVSSDRGTLSLAVFCENLPDLDTAERAIGLIAREELAVTGIVPIERDRLVYKGWASCHANSIQGNPALSRAAQNKSTGCWVPMRTINPSNQPHPRQLFWCPENDPAWRKGSRCLGETPSVCAWTQAHNSVQSSCVLESRLAATRPQGVLP